MKTYQQFCEDAASQYKAGMMAYHSTPEARLAARRRAAAERSRRLASDFAERQKAKGRKKQYHNEELQTEQTPVMDPDKYGAHNLAVTRRQQTQKSGVIRRAQQKYYSNQSKYQTAKNRTISNILKREEDT